MARPREFDVDDALDKAMQVFWNKGYEGTGLTDLLQAMGIARGSLYKAFGDKRALFLATLSYYDRVCISPAVALLSDETISEGATRIARQLETIVLVVENENDRRGCFLCNTAVDQAPHDSEIQKQCQRMMNRMQEGFLIALQASEKVRHLSEQELKNRSSVLNIAYNGLRVMVKAGYPVKDIRMAINVVLDENHLL